jgi:hypothetical protein
MMVAAAAAAAAMTAAAAAAATAGDVGQQAADPLLLLVVRLHGKRPPLLCMPGAWTALVWPTRNSPQPVHGACLLLQACCFHLGQLLQMLMGWV